LGAAFEDFWNVGPATPEAMPSFHAALASFLPHINQPDPPQNRRTARHTLPNIYITRPENAKSKPHAIVI
jgi:hypothetical protein